MSDDHHYKGGHELEGVNAPNLFKIIFGLGLVTLLAATAVVQWFYVQRQELTLKRAAEGSPFLAAHREKVSQDLQGVDRIAKKAAEDPSVLAPAPEPPGFIHPDGPAPEPPPAFEPPPTEGAEGAEGAEGTEGTEGATEGADDQQDDGAVEKQDEENKGAEGKDEENKGAEKKGAEENKGAEKKGAEKKGAEKKGAEKKGAEKKGAEKKGAEKKGAEKKGAEKKDEKDGE